MSYDRVFGPCRLCGWKSPSDDQHKPSRSGRLDHTYPRQDAREEPNDAKDLASSCPDNPTGPYPTILDTRNPAMTQPKRVEVRQLGRTGPLVSALGLGCMSLSGVYGESND